MTWKMGLCDDILIKPNLMDGLSMLGGREEMSYGVNTSGQDIMPILSPNGKEMYFTRKDDYENMGAEENDDIWVVERTDYGYFRNAEHLEAPLNNEGHNFMISLAEDGDLAILGNVYRPDGSMTSGISASRRVNGFWLQPYKLEVEDFTNSSDYSEYHISPDLEVMVLALERKEGLGGRDLYVSFKIGDNLYGAPQHLGNAVNSADTEMTPWISPNKKYIVFASKGHPGYGGNDLYFSHRLDDTWKNWSKPVNMGPAVNTNYWDAYFSASPGNENAFFCSVKGSIGGSDIFKIKLPRLLRKEFGLE